MAMNRQQLLLSDHKRRCCDTWDKAALGWDTDQRQEMFIVNERKACSWETERQIDKGREEYHNEWLGSNDEQNGEENLRGKNHVLDSKEETKENKMAYMPNNGKNGADGAVVVEEEGAIVIAVWRLRV